jgi:4-phosphopantoate--beta-alanine ligase
MIRIPDDHPRAGSLRIREKLIEGFDQGVVTTAGLIAHGRGEAFDYILGEETSSAALRAMQASASTLLGAEKAVISVNGIVAALSANDVVRLANASGAAIEVNLFYRSSYREKLISRILEEAGAKEILGVGKDASGRIPELNSERRRVDPRGILKADVVLVPLEDGDRTEALVKLGKKVIAIDLNPFSRTARKATITIVDNLTRAVPKLAEIAESLAEQDAKKRMEILHSYDNKKNLAESIKLVEKRLAESAGTINVISREVGQHEF